MKGLTSIEMAILLAIILVIAVAVGWYVYTTFLASTTGTPRLNVINAIYWTNDGKLELTVQNPGPVATVYIGSVYLQGVSCSLSKTSDGQNVEQNVKQSAIPVEQKDGPKPIEVYCNPGLAPAGSTISGQVVLTSGQSFPFTAQVRQGEVQQG